eukprot:jgi/Mesen1/9645/ME000067S09036
MWEGREREKEEWEGVRIQEVPDVGGEQAQQEQERQASQGLEGSAALGRAPTPTWRLYASQAGALPPAVGDLTGLGGRGSPGLEEEAGADIDTLWLAHERSSSAACWQAASWHDGREAAIVRFVMSLPGADCGCRVPARRTEAWQCHLAPPWPRAAGKRGRYSSGGGGSWPEAEKGHVAPAAAAAGRSLQEPLRSWQEWWEAQISGSGGYHTAQELTHCLRGGCLGVVCMRGQESGRTRGRARGGGGGGVCVCTCACTRVCVYPGVCGRLTTMIARLAQAPTGGKEPSKGGGGAEVRGGCARRWRWCLRRRPLRCSACRVPSSSSVVAAPAGARHVGLPHQRPTSGGDAPSGGLIEPEDDEDQGWRRQIFLEYVTDMFDAYLTPDKDLPLEVRTTLLHAAGEVAARVKRCYALVPAPAPLLPTPMSLHSPTGGSGGMGREDRLAAASRALGFEWEDWIDVPTLVGSHLELYRRTREHAGGDALDSLSLAEREQRLQQALSVVGEIHPACVSPDLEYLVGGRLTAA